MARRQIIRGCGNASEREACKAALAAHIKKYGDYSPESVRTVYSVAVDGEKLSVEVVNKPRSYVATCMNKVRRLRCLITAA